MKKIAVIAVLLIAFSNLVAQQPDYAASEKYDVANLLKKAGTLEVIPFFINGTDKFWFRVEDANDNSQTFFVDPATKTKMLLYNKYELAQKIARLTQEKVDTTTLNFLPRFSADEKRMIFKYKSKEYSYDIKKFSLAENKELRNENRATARPTGQLSPDKEWLVYSRGHNLYLKNTVDSQETQLSADGGLYYSFNLNEFDSSSQNNASNAIWTKHPNFFYAVREDNRKVQTVSITHATAARPWVQTKKYQFPGDKFVTQYELFIGDAASKKLLKVAIEKWPDQELAVTNVNASAKELFFIRKRRTLDEAELCAVDLATGKLRTVINEVSKPTLNGELFKVHVINMGKEIIWWSDRTGWGHYYLYDSFGNLKGQITSGDFTAGKIVSIDTLKREFYFYGYGKEAGRDPYLQHLYKVSFDGGKQTLLTPENAHHKVFFSLSGNYFVDNYSRIDLEPKTILRDKAGKWICGVYQPDLRNLFAYGWKMPEPFIVKAGDGKTDLYGIMWKPYNFDSTRKYPLISQVYPGPQIETVWPDFTLIDKYNNTSLAQVGFIVVVMGHRGGSPLRSKEYFHYSYGNLRDYALPDDKYGLQQLARRFNFIDSTRIGIFGHSGGGAMAAAAICTYPDFYKVAVASAGNYDNSIYYRSWGETFQGIKEATDTATGKTSFQFKTAVNASLVKNLQGHLLLAMGEVDDNVLPSNTYYLADALVKAGKDFDMLVLPNQNHHYEGVYKTYFENKVRHYFGNYLMGNKN